MNLALKVIALLFIFSCGNTTKNTANIQEVEITEVKAEIPITLATKKHSPVLEKGTVTEDEEVPSPIERTIENEQKKETKPEILMTEAKEPNKEKMPIKKKEETKKIQIAEVLSYKSWEVLLKKYVDDEGNVDYAGFKNEATGLQSFLDLLAKNEPASTATKNERLAYYINLYNAATVKLILDNYPTNSIKDIRNPWGKKWVKVGDEELSLGNIEHKILRKMNEPRIHFAINCASYSCPKLINKPFTASGMEKQLQQATKDFINDTTRNKFDGEKNQLSEIFKWYKGDFTDNGKLLDYIEKYADTAIDKDKKLTYLNYDWSLNEAK